MDERDVLNTKLDLLKEIEGRDMVKKVKVFHELRSRYMNRLGELVLEDEKHNWFIGECDSDKTWEGQLFLHERGFPTYLPLEEKGKAGGGGRRIQRAGKKLAERHCGPVVHGCIWFAMPKKQWTAKELFTAPRTIWKVQGIGGFPSFITCERMAQFIQDNRKAFSPIDVNEMHQFKIGNHVQILEGAFYGVVAEIKDVDKHHAWVNVGMMGADKAKISIDKLEKIS